jgi:hypothetical protein
VLLAQAKEGKPSWKDPKKDYKDHKSKYKDKSRDLNIMQKEGQEGQGRSPKGKEQMDQGQ